MKIKALFLIFSLGLFSACATKSAINPRFNLESIQRLGVVGAPSAGGQAMGMEAIFSKYLLDQGFTVVERSQMSALVDEVKLGQQGYLDPSGVREMGRILGVDALLIAQVTDWQPERKSVVMVESVKRYEEPLYRERIIQTPEGQTQRVQEVVGTTRRQERSHTPHTHVIDARVSLVAKLVEVETGELIWAGSAENEAVNPQLALDVSIRSLVRSMMNQWRRARHS